MGIDLVGEDEAKAEDESSEAEEDCSSAEVGELESFNGLEAANFLEAACCSPGLIGRALEGPVVGVIGRAACIIIPGEEGRS